MGACFGSGKNIEIRWELLLYFKEARARSRLLTSTRDRSDKTNRSVFTQGCSTFSNGRSAAQAAPGKLASAPVGGNDKQWHRAATKTRPASSVVTGVSPPAPPSRLQILGRYAVPPHPQDHAAPGMETDGGGGMKIERESNFSCWSECPSLEFPPKMSTGAPTALVTTRPVHPQKLENAAGC